MSKAVDNDTTAVLLGAGTAAAPAVGMGVANTGFYAEDTDSVSVSTGGVKRAKISSAGLSLVPAGSAAAPSLTFEDASTGFYRSAANEIAVSASGAQVFKVTATGVTIPNGYGLTVAANASLSAPAYSFISDTTTGFTSTGSGVLNWVAGGTEVLRGVSTYLYAYVPVRITAGTAGFPGMTFTSDADTGIYRVASDQIGLACAGNAVTTFTSTDITMAKTLNLADGTAALPALAFTSDPNTGIYATGVADQIGFSAGGSNRATLSTTKMDFTNGISLAGGSDIMSIYAISTPAPTMDINGSAFGGLTTSNSRAIRIGKYVHVQGVISWTSVPAATGTWTITSLLPVAAAVKSVSASISWDGTTDVQKHITWFEAAASATTLTAVYCATTGALTTSFSNADFDSSGTLRLNMTYIST